MLKFLVTSFLMLVVAASALAKPNNVYPASCNDLWTAVMDTLNNPSNYGVIATDAVTQRASFVVVGNLTQYTDKVALTDRDGGCAMKETFLEVGFDNGDWRQFHHRLAQSLTRLQALKSKPAETQTGQQ